jgi:ABC-2 type transport system permease protein
MRPGKMNTERIIAVIMKDWKELSKDRRALIPIIIIPVMFVLVMPTIMIQSISAENVTNSTNNQQFIKNMPKDAIPKDFSLQQAMIYSLLVFFFAPFFLIIPIMTSSVIAANSFAGEKERRTIEGLLYTPITDAELTAAKMLVSFIPSVVVSWISFLAYTILVNFMCLKLFGGVFFPNLTWLLMIILLVPAVSFLALSIIILVSQRAKNVWEAQQLSGFLVVPVIMLLVSQGTGLLVFSPVLVVIAFGIVLIADGILFTFVIKAMNRETIVTRFT